MTGGGRVDGGQLTLGALGGKETFGGQAADVFRATYDEFGTVAYFDDATSMMKAVEAGDIHAGCVPEQTARSGFHERSQGRVAPPTSPFFVLAEVTHAYRCSLLVKAGTTLDQIRKVVGHTGSILQSRPWLEEHLPQAEIVIVDTNSLGAARTVRDGDGSIASVGTSDAAAAVGLDQLVSDIDGGSMGNYWALGSEPRFAGEPTQLVITARLSGDGSLGDLVRDLHEVGYRLQTVHTSSRGVNLYEYDHVMRYGGSGTLSGVERALAGTPTARLIGAFVARPPRSGGTS